MKPDNWSRKFDNDMLLQFLIAAKYRVYRHVLLILFLVVNFSNSRATLVEPVNTYLKIGFFIILLLLFYINMYILIPNFVFKDRYFKYFLWVIVLFVVALLFFLLVRYMIKPYFKDQYKENGENANILTFTFVFFIFIAASAAIKLFQRSIVINQRVNELETATIQSELEQLKNQINPHFLFNMLNNVNVLTHTNPQKASQVVMKLSDLLRYQLYDSTRNKVLLTADIHFLEDFLNLEKIRRDNFEYSIATEGELIGVQISPLLFITFVENAVKHSMDAEGLSFINVFFNARQHEINFKCINSKSPGYTNSNGHGGLGLTNVKRRLELLYPGKHYLYIHDDKDVFSVDLKILI